MGLFLDAIYNKQSAEKHGEAIGAFYMKLTDAGISPEHAADLSREYMLAVMSIMRNTRPPVEEDFIYDM